MKNRLREIRKSKKMYQKDVADFLNVAISTYSYWERGTYDIDNLSLKRLAVFFDVSIDYLLGKDLTKKEDLGKSPQGVLFTELEQEIVDMVVNCNEQEQRLIVSYITGLIDKGNLYNSTADHNKYKTKGNNS